MNTKNTMKTHQTFKSGPGRLSLAGLAGLVFLLTLGTVLSAIAQSRYIVTDLGTLPGLADSYVNGGIENIGGMALNNRGQVAVFANNAANPYPGAGDSSFLWTGPGEIELLPGLPAATDTIAAGLNDRDQVVGFSGPNSAGYEDAVLWKNGIAHDLGTAPGDIGSGAVAINNNGVAVGVSYTAGFTVLHSAAWYDGKIELLPPLASGDILTEANMINDRGQIVGESGPNYWANYSAVLWDHDKIIDLGTLGGLASAAYGINNFGQIVGQAQTASGDWHASLWENGAITDLGVFGSDPFGGANSINDRGQIVGFSGQGYEDITTAHALLWQNGSMTDLQTLIPADSGWVLQQANAINELGQIAGTGLHNGQIRAFLLTPAGCLQR
jgi:probable HAF family extracellular repeat protein